MSALELILLFIIIFLFFSGSQPSSYIVDFTNLNTGVPGSKTVTQQSALLTGLDAGAKYSLTVTPLLGNVRGTASSPIQISPGKLSLHYTRVQGGQLSKKISKWRRYFVVYNSICFHVFSSNVI